MGNPKLFPFFTKAAKAPALKIKPKLDRTVFTVSTINVNLQKKTVYLLSFNLRLKNKEILPQIAVLSFYTSITLHFGYVKYSF